MSKGTVSADCHLDPWNLQLTTACRSQMSAAVKGVNAIVVPAVARKAPSAFLVEARYSKSTRDCSQRNRV